MAPLYGPGLLVAAELTWWAMDRARLAGEPVGVARRRGLLLVTMAVTGAMLALLAVLAGDLTGAATGLEVRVLGVGAVIVVGRIVAVLAQPGRRPLRPSGAALCSCHVTSDGARCDRLHG